MGITKLNLMCVCVGMCVGACVVCVCMCVRTRVFMCTFVCMCVLFVCVSARMYVCAYVCICVYYSTRFLLLTCFYRSEVAETVVCSGSILMYIGYVLNLKMD